MLLLLSAKSPTRSPRESIVFASDEMFTWLERASAENDAGMTQLLTIPFIHNYRADPRFAALCQKLKLPVPRSANLNK